MIRFLLAFLFAALAVPAVAAGEGRFVEKDVESSKFGKVHVTVWLPPGYEEEGERRYPVLYMNDGQNVFFKERSAYSKVWAADKAALALIRSGKADPFLIVAVDHPGKERYQRYFPVAVASPALRAGIEGFAGPLQGDDYVDFLADELKPLVDRTYRTKKEARFTAIAGSSMGALISLYAIAERPDAFSRAAAVSHHSPLIGPDEIAKAPGLEATIKGSWRTYVFTRLRTPAGRKLWMDHGEGRLDGMYPPYQQVIDSELERIGWVRGSDFESRVYRGTEHEENSWAERLPEILAWLTSGWNT